MTRQEHVEWCKNRAKEYLERGEARNALASMFSDLNKHPETEGHPAINLGMMLLASGNLATTEQAQKFIDGFN